MSKFSFYNVKYSKHPVEKWIIVTGEIRNESDRSFNTAVFRVKLFVSQQILGGAILKIQGLRNKASKPFEVMVEGAHYDLIPKITNCEILFESSF